MSTKLKKGNLLSLGKRVSALLFTFSWGISAYGQVIKSSVQSTSGKLPGASIVALSFKGNTSSDLQGDFTLTASDTGMVSLQISYIGYQTRTVDIRLKRGINEISPIELAAGDGSALAEVIVSGTMAPSQAKALNIKKQAVAIMDVLAADAIGKLPDRNAAEAVQRMQGVAVAKNHGEADVATVRGTPFAWTSVLFNGSRLPSPNIMGNRSMPLDAIPSEIIQYVQVAKAITPDMEGDAIGGSINFVTRTSPSKRILSVSGAGGYNTFSKNGTYNGSLVYGDRFLNDRLGLILSAATWARQWGSDAFDVSYNTGLANDRQKNSIGSVMLKRYIGERQTNGISLGSDYKIAPGHTVFLRAMFNKFDDIRPVYEAYVDYNRSRFQYNNRYSHYQTAIYGAEIGGEHQLSRIVKADWGVSDHKSKYFLETPPANERKGLPIATFHQSIKSGFNNLSNDGLRYWGFDSPNGMGGDPMNFDPGIKDANEVLDPGKLNLTQLVITQLDNSERDRVAQLNFHVTASPALKLKVGGKYRRKDRDNFFGSNFVYLPGAALGVENAPPLRSLSSLETKSFPRGVSFFGRLNGNYDSFKLDPLTKNQILDVFSPQFMQANGFIDKTDPMSAASIYTAEETVSSGYVMTDYDFSDRLKLVIGLRNEFTRTKLYGKRVEPQETGNQLVNSEIENNYNALLPMVHLKYKLSQDANLRGAYTRTFVRPNFGDMTPGTSIDVSSTPATISQGNPELRPTFSNNFDLMGEYFFQHIGILTGGLFYKNISDVIFTDISMQTINGREYRVSQAQNLNAAKIFGLELGINRRFDFLQGFWKNFGVEFNYSYVDSETEVPRVGAAELSYDKTALPNQSKHLFNAILFYEGKGLMVRLAGNYRGKSIETIDQKLGPQFYKWIDNNFTLDATATVSLSARVKAFLELNNLTNSAVSMYMGDSRRISSHEVYGSRGQAGIRWDIIK